MPAPPCASCWPAPRPTPGACRATRCAPSADAPCTRRRAARSTTARSSPPRRAGRCRRSRPGRRRRPSRSSARACRAWTRRQSCTAGRSTASTCACPACATPPSPSVRCSTARWRAWTTAAALRVPGVRQVVRIAGHENPTFLMPGVAVVADSTWAAFKGRDALRVQWDEGALAAETTASLSAQFAELARARARPCARWATSRRRSPAPRAWSRRTTSRRSCRMPRSNRSTARPTCATATATSPGRCRCRPRARAWWRRPSACRSSACTCRPRGSAAGSDGGCSPTTPPRRRWCRRRWARRCRSWARARTTCGTTTTARRARGGCAWASTARAASPRGTAIW